VLAVGPASVDTGAAVTVENAYLSDRVGWREITAAGDGVGLDSPLPATSVTRELTDYPRDLLGSPLDQRSATMRVSAVGAGSAGSVRLTPGGDPASRWLAPSP
jgi:nickel/cobalt exporter